MNNPNARQSAIGALNLAKNQLSGATDNMNVALQIGDPEMVSNAMDDLRRAFDRLNDALEKVEDAFFSPVNDHAAPTLEGPTLVRE